MNGQESEIQRAIVIRHFMKPIISRTEFVLKSVFPKDVVQIQLLTQMFMENKQASWWINNGKDILYPFESAQSYLFSSGLSNCLVCATIMIADHTSLSILLDEPVNQIDSARSDALAWSSIIEKAKTQIWLISQNLGLI
ncbi:hypothetical protein JL100_027490 [Skermanella mucosa]|uniref:hypothetical protein n=1 Tax=Skermanella mucosa TaxID=1789672 RepID=UPI00192B266C|nr:hypothetical protein [Skermanella mucosa]UEM20777.1 hypothetical protein JL100_027490 [Skermanella mucosa]